MLMQGCNRQQRRNGHVIFIYATVRENQNVRAVTVCPVRLDKETVNRFFKACVLIIGNRNIRNMEAFLVHGPDLHEIRVRQDRIVDFDHMTVFRFL